jgi:hypothetical protein
MRRTPPSSRRSFTLRLAASCALLVAAAGCGGRPFAEGGSREVTVLTQLPPDAPELLLFRAVVEREAIRIEDEKAYVVHVAPVDSARAYRARTLVCIGSGPESEVPKPFRSLLPLLRESGRPYAFLPDVWLRGQAVGLVWSRTPGELLRALERDQNRLYHALDRAVYGTVRSRVLSLPRDEEAESHLREVLGMSLHVPRGYSLRIDRALGAACLFDEGPPARLLRIQPVAGAPVRDPARILEARARLARAFRPGERTLSLVEPMLEPNEMAGSVAARYGRWEDTEVSAAGPFRFYVVTRAGRSYYVDLSVFAPGRPKLPYLRELQAIAETLGRP